MFASFGPISFQPLASPTKLEIEKKYHYEALNVIGAPPVLQWIYDNLRHVELSIYLHNFWCKPQTAINALTQLADFHVPQQFVFGNQNNLGNFVISNYRLKQRWMADDGSVIAAEMDLELTEYVAPSTLQSNTMTVGTIGTVHALVLHRREIIALNDYSRNNGGLLRIVRDFLWIPKWNGQNKKEI